MPQNANISIWFSAGCQRRTISLCWCLGTIKAISLRRQFRRYWLSVARDYIFVYKIRFSCGIRSEIGSESIPGGLRLSHMGASGRTVGGSRVSMYQIIRRRSTECARLCAISQRATSTHGNAMGSIYSPVKSDILVRSRAPTSRHIMMICLRRRHRPEDVTLLRRRAHWQMRRNHWGSLQLWPAKPQVVGRDDKPPSPRTRGPRLSSSDFELRSFGLALPPQCWFRSDATDDWRWFIALFKLSRLFTEQSLWLRERFEGSQLTSSS